jgi:hypothetical protein
MPQRERYLALGLLVFQNSSLALTMRYSRTMGGDLYFASTAVVVCEALKFLVSLVLLQREEPRMHLVEIFRRKVGRSVPVVRPFVRHFVLRSGRGGGGGEREGEQSVRQTVRQSLRSSSAH